MNITRIALLLSCIAPLNATQNAVTFEDLGNYSITTQSQKKSSPLTAEVSAGELLDKITILEIKLEKIQDPQKLLNIQNELRSLLETVSTHIIPSQQLLDFIAQLLEINKKLWDIEDKLRIKESRHEFDQEFIELARAVYFTNDSRAEIKRKINTLLGSRLIEEKSLPSYKTQAA